MENITNVTETQETVEETVEVVLDAEKVTETTTLAPKRLTRVVTSRVVSEW
ncbi:hypothetical protein OS242_12955 [Tumebacillus sp. DT12]|uniref:Uncharacterized protein n=1 Tax=Tumebacillus lacus TaxID=2995335 RepID=A0ABT3X340_9BACL|nr:hypothetical protein [Tumebacillus lacus]MCX7570866.1 hypothetical protein [Tumebacillus lacus]